MMNGLSWGPIKKTEMKDFCVEIMKRLNVQRKNEQFSDVVLEVGSGDDLARLKAHRIVLCAASPFFYNALNSDMKEKNEGVIRLENTSKAAMEELLEYVYTGHVGLTQSKAFDLLEVADFFVILSLKEITSKFIAQTLSSSNCLMAYYFAVKYQCTDLHWKARDFICKNFMRVVEQEDFQNLSMKEVEEWISSHDIEVRGEEDIFQVIVKWWEGKEYHEREEFFELFRHVRLVYMSRNYVFNEILPHSLVADNKTCSSFVLEAMKDVSSGSEECFFAQPPRNCLKTSEDCLVVTGRNATICYVYSENSWYELSDQSVSRHTMCASHGKLYINRPADCKIKRYDPALNSWGTVISYSGGQRGASLVNFQGFLYLIGGAVGNEHAKCVHRYNPDTNLWQKVAPMSISRSGLCAVADKESLYAIGGRTRDQLVDVVERFDPKTNTWCKAASICEKKTCPHGVMLRGKVFLFGGLTSLTSSDDVFSSIIEMYDPISNIWTAIQSTSAPKRCFNATGFKGTVFVSGIWDQESSEKYFLRVYDVDKNEWKPCAKFPDDFHPGAMAPLRIPRGILDFHKIIIQPITPRS